VFYVAFEVNRANLGNRQKRVPMQQLCEQWNSVLEGLQGKLSFKTSYRHTGNYILSTDSEYSVSQLNQILFEKLGRRFCIFKDEEFLGWVVDLEGGLKDPDIEIEGYRLTPGAVFNINPETGIPPSYPIEGKFLSSSFYRPRVQGIWKKDRLRVDGKALDPENRGGGWGWAARIMTKTHGGSWTARALSTLKGIARKIKTLQPVMDFNEKGFLGDSITDFKKSVEIKYAEFFELYRRTNEMAHEMKFRLEVPNNDGQKVMAAALFIRLLNSFQVVAILCQQGLMLDAKIILRGALESVFILNLLCREKEFVNEYIGSDQVRRLTLFNVAKSTSDPNFESLRNYAYSHCSHNCCIGTRF